MEKARAMIAWYEERELPKELRLNVCTNITNFERFFSTHKAAILEHLEPMSLDWINHYMRLYDAKKLLENEL